VREEHMASVWTADSVDKDDCKIIQGNRFG
jgi:hypothetical protein